jgi:hypothetical protein
MLAFGYSKYNALDFEYDVNIIINWRIYASNHFFLMCHYRV